MKIKIYFLLATLLMQLQLKLQAQAPTVQWQKSIGGSSTDVGRGMVQAADGGYIFAGGSRSGNGDFLINKGGTDAWILKLDASQNIVWQTNVGGSSDDDQSVLIASSDGGYVIGGRGVSSDGDFTGAGYHAGEDAWLAKLDGSGNLLWVKQYGGSDDDELLGIAETPDHGFICIGQSASTDGDVSGNHGGLDYWVFKTDGSGNLLWQKCYGGSLNEEGLATSTTNDGGYIFTGLSASADGDVTGHHAGTGNDAWTVKTDASGNIQWKKSFGGSLDDFAFNIAQVADGNYVFAGRSQSSDGDASFNHGGYDLWMVKFNTNGHIMWQKSFGGSGDEQANSFLQTSAGDYVVLTRTTSNDGDVSGSHGGGFDFWLTGVSQDGNTLEYQHCYGGSGDDESLPFCLAATSDGGYIIGGESNSNDGDITGNHGDYDWCILKLNPVCLHPATSTVSHITSNSAKVSWSPVAGASGYRIKYRPVGSNSFTTKISLTTSKMLNGLSPSTTYEYKLATTCNTINSTWTALANFTTLAMRVQSSLVPSEGFIVYPNPAENIILVQFENVIPKQITISDVSGKVMNVIDVNSVPISIDISQFSSGSYLISAIDESGIRLTKKFLKE